MEGDQASHDLQTENAIIQQSLIADTVFRW